MTKYVIKATVESFLGNRQEIVWDTPIERLAHDEFNRLVAEYPKTHFELYKIVHEETCLKFTGK